ncbi:MAG: hypothetical protein GEU80_16500 [Dehalococcoidia bacterium]|nr:hypothetical protein [Dehalococcoidia bacterium]
MTTGTVCAICQRTEHNAALLSPCYGCGSMFHLNPYSNREGIDCGDAILGETLGVHFYCQRCLDEIDREEREAAGDSPHARAAAMVESLHAGGLPLPPPAPAEPTPPRDGAPPPAKQRGGARRRYRRVD